MATTEELAQLGAWLDEHLGLTRKPVGLTRVGSKPDGVDRVAGRFPSACSFWREAQDAVFYADAAAHQECPIGVLTMGFEIESDRAEYAEGLLEQMCRLEYINAEELEHLPKMAGGHSGIVYGPIDRLPVDPEVVVIVARPDQAMQIAEACHALDWGESTGMSVFGRPACGALPAALLDGQPAFSLACVGARTYVGMDAGEVVLALPHTALDGLIERLSTINEANEKLAVFHRERLTSVH